VIARDRTLCAYCGEPATTDDHVPPKFLYTLPLPSNLVTAPACATCNNGPSNDDAEFRNHLSIIAGSFGESANAAELIDAQAEAPKPRGPYKTKARLAAENSN
jgi:5-methylcytosine-specific restriction endonuclease McrA